MTRTSAELRSDPNQLSEIEARTAVTARRYDC